MANYKFIEPQYKIVTNFHSMKKMEHLVRNAFCQLILNDNKHFRKHQKLVLTYYLIELNNEFMICDSEYKSKVSNFA